MTPYLSTTRPTDHLLIVQVGSRLHGTATETSDHDYLIVSHGHDKTKHVIANGIDLKHYNLSTFMRLATEGDPQILEALFAPDEFVIFESDLIRALRKNFYASPGKAYESYRGCIRAYQKIGTPKAIAHIKRLQQNFDDIVQYGRFNPRMT